MRMIPLRRVLAASLVLLATVPALLVAWVMGRASADAIEEMEPEAQVEIMEDLHPSRAADILEEMSPDDAADLVAEDLRMAQEIGIQGVPFFVAGMRVAVSGAQDPDILRQLLAEARQREAAA